MPRDPDSLDTPTTPLTELADPFLKRHRIRLYVKREDLIHSQLSGNKWHKLQLNLAEAKRRNCKTVVSFGGAYSNHLHALAYAGRIAGLQTVGLVRGECHEPLNPTLQDARNQGMELVYLSRQQYRRRNDPDFQLELAAQYPDSLLIPEGGANALGAAGCETIAQQVAQQLPEPHTICLPCGTGTSLAGVINGCQPPTRQVLGFSVLKGEAANTAIKATIEGFIKSGVDTDWSLLTDYHCGGYAKLNPQLVAFIDDFEQRHGIPLDPIYTGKLFFGLYDLIEQDYFQQGTTIVAIHTGGLQGRRGMKIKMDGLRS